VATVEARDDGSLLLTITRDLNSYAPLGKYEVKDETDDVPYQFTNKEAKVVLSYYGDESDALGFMEGSIRAPEMTGYLKCLCVE
jgi:hypothetical protein